MNGKPTSDPVANFRSAAEKFHLAADDESGQVVVRNRGDVDNGAIIDTLLNTVRKDGPQRWLIHKLQRYIVNIHRRDAMTLLRQGDLEEISPNLFVQVSDWLHDAHPELSSDRRPSKSDDCVV
jgi:CRISPR-associated endonuclease/helicase Cas3